MKHKGGTKGENTDQKTNPQSKIQNPKSQFDPITLEILWRRLISIVDEADASVARTAFSSLLRDAHDYTCMFTDSRGQELVQGTFCTPGQAGAMALGVKIIINSIPLQEYQPGDVFIVNDPWLLAGHLNDVCVLSPIFYKNKPVAFTACVFHHSDIGGRVASDRICAEYDPVECEDSRRSHRGYPLPGCCQPCLRPKDHRNAGR
jgi:N-methylhydantoinase B